MAIGAARLALAGIKNIGWDFGIHVQFGSTWQLVDDFPAASFFGIDGATLTLNRPVDYENTTGNTRTANQARVVAGSQGVGIPDNFLILFPAGSIGGIELVDGQILRFTTIECDITDGS